MAIPKPDVPGTVLRFIGSTQPRVPPAASDTVAIPVVHDWGPLGVDPPGSDGRQGGPQLLEQFSEWTGVFGDSDTAGRTAVAGCFAGQGLPGEGGAGGVLAWRMAGAGSARAVANVTSNAALTPNVIDFQGYYVGTRGNRISYSIDNDPADSTKDRIQFYFDGVLQDTYVYDHATADIDALVAVISKRSRLVKPVAVVGASSSRLTQTTPGVPVSLAGGNDGAAPASGDHLAALDGIKYKSFGVLVPYDLTSTPIKAAYYSWLQDELAANRPIRLLFGGAVGEVLSDAITDAAVFDDDHVIRVGVGTWHDDLLDKDLSTSQLAPRIAGILAAKGEDHAITFAEVAGIHFVAGPAEDELADAIRGGVVVLGQTSSPDADVHIVQGVTTYTDQGNDSKPYDVFSDARLVGIMDNFIRDMKTWGDKIVIGNLPVNDDTRSKVRGQARILENKLQGRGLILPADPTQNPPIPDPWVVCDDPGDPALADTIPFTYGWRFARTANNVLGEGAVL